MFSFCKRSLFPKCIFFLSAYPDNLTAFGKISLSTQHSYKGSNKTYARPLLCWEFVFLWKHSSLLKSKEKSEKKLLTCPELFQFWNISVLKSCSSISKLQSEPFPLVLRIPEPINYILAVRKPLSNYCRLPFNASEEDEGEIQEASRAAAEQISVDAAVVAVLSKMGGIFIFKEEQRMATEGFSLWKTCFFAFLSSWFWHKVD